MDTKTYAKELSEVIQIDCYVALLSIIGNKLNGHKDRFDKADIVEQSLECYTGGRLKWVDEIGRDHYDTVRGFDVEFKYMANGLFTPKGKPKTVIKVKLKNSLGKNKGVEIKNLANFYLLAQQDSMAVISGEDIKKYLVSVPDGIEAHIPFSAVEFVFSKVKNVCEVDCIFSYYEEKKELQKHFIKIVQENVQNCSSLTE